MNVLPLYKLHWEALNFCKDFFSNGSLPFGISSLILFGSATYPGCFDPENSDLDIMAIVTGMGSAEFDGIAKELERKELLRFSQKPPTVVRDFIGDRIEFSFKYERVVLDCTIMSSLLPSYETLTSNAVRDSTDIIIGAVVQHGILIAGDELDLSNIGYEINPYYAETLRKQRLLCIEQYLAPKVNRLKKMAEMGSSEVIDYYFRYRTTFLKWFFCYYRQYPVSLYKHLSYQLSLIPQLPKEDKEILLLVGDKTVTESIASFVNLYEKVVDISHNE